MKIRTDFVTNSSSSSYMTVQVKNQVLCELLRDYKKKLGLGSVSKGLIELIPFEDESGCGLDTSYPADLGQAISEVWKLLNKWGKEYPELGVALNNSKDDIDTCFERVLISKGYYEWGGDGDLRFNWDFSEETTQEDIDEGAAEEGVYYYSADLKEGAAVEIKGNRHYITIGGYLFLAIKGFSSARLYGEEELNETEFSVDKVNVEEIAEKYKKQKTETVIAEDANVAITGKTFVVTGDVHIFKNRNELKTYIETNGGKLSGSVSAKTDYLINNDATSTSSKNIAAKKNNVPIITEDEFIAQFNVQIG